MVNGHADMVAFGYKYHNACMTKLLMKKESKTEIKNENDEMHNADIHTETFTHLIDEITPTLIQSKCIYYLSQIRDRYQRLLQQNNENVDATYRSSCLKKRLQNHYGDSIQFIPQDGKTDIVYSSSITIPELIKEVVKMKEKCNEVDDLSQDVLHLKPSSSNTNAHPQSVFEFGNSIRSSIKDTNNVPEDNENGSSHEVDISIKVEHIPISLYNLIACILTASGIDNLDENNRVCLNEQMKRKVLSICQDIMATVSVKQMPKHVALGLHILRQTRSRELVTILNRFGHCISYIEAQRYITAMANKVEQETNTRGVFIPSNIRPGVFTQFALDNLDFQMDNINGKTLHATTHNIYQYRNGQGIDTTTRYGKSRLTNFDASEFRIQESELKIQDRRKSRSIKDIDMQPFARADVVNVLDENTIWMLSRRQVTPGKIYDVNWKSFHESYCDTVQRSTTIGFGPMFPESPTNPDVVLKSIDYFLQVSTELNQDATVITCDQAIYDIVKGKPRAPLI